MYHNETSLQIAKYILQIGTISGVILQDMSLKNRYDPRPAVTSRNVYRNRVSFWYSSIGTIDSNSGRRCSLKKRLLKCQYKKCLMIQTVVWSMNKSWISELSNKLAALRYAHIPAFVEKINEKLTRWKNITLQNTYSIMECFFTTSLCQLFSTNENQMWLT